MKSSPSNTAPLDPSRIRLGAIAVATGFGLLECAKGLLGRELGGPLVSFPDLLLENLPWWYGWVLLAPFVVFMARRFPVVGVGHRRRVLAARIGIHFGVASILVTLHITAIGILFFYSFRERIRAPGIRVFLTTWNQSFYVSDLVTYCMIAGVFYVVDYMRRFSESARRSDQLARETAELQRGLADARLDALRSELNPHFLFNALNGVSGLVRADENAAAVTMLARVAGLLRTTLERGSGIEVPLAEELAVLDQYLDIERARFGDRLTVSIDVPDELGDVMVPSFALQPLVENAVRHGIAARPGPGKILLTAREHGESVLVVIRDTGIGVDPGAAEGVGVGNTRARLAQLYGDRGTLVLRSWESGGESELRVPMRRSVVAPP